MIKYVDGLTPEWKYITLDLGFLVPDGTDFKALPENFQNLVADWEPEWPASHLIGTHAVNGFVVLGVRVKKRLTKEEIDQMIEAFGLDWICAYIGSAYCIVDNGMDEDDKPLPPTKEIILPINKAALLPYLDEAPIIDPENGEITGYMPRTMEETIIINWYSCAPGEEILI
jgi:hypothetical protein